MGGDADERAARAALAWVCEPGDPLVWQLVAAHHPVEVRDMLSRPGASFAARAEIRHLRPEQMWATAAAAVDQARQDGGRVLIPTDPDWPAGLADLDVDEPVCLWARGPATVAAPAGAVSIVGSRASSPYGNHVAGYFAAQLAGRGVTVVSCGGLGIGGAALRSALVADGGGAAVAVLPCGLDQRHPYQHRALFDRLAADGLLLSAWPPDAAPSMRRAVANQRLLAAVTAGTVCVEASTRSRALSAVRHAVELGRVGMVVPGPVTSATSAGCHELLRADARVRAVADVDQVLADVTAGHGVQGGGGW
ncbi:hypothetical protein GCM10009541_53680 [Micromonospora gifhornensis]|uniref:Smf/DprA SLOG domain-containing protein n=1 Tax=Micromonospora gifhornensis TaxID=84594 RepID=A0ABQ4IL42_9ACTN|nr:DNA-processing protein DprA [Micromonospora gifhornensis]GIJ18423.1 hypothetical protein Vgi01_51070 [Micromonospora gifhornensis]